MAEHKECQGPDLFSPDTVPVPFICTRRNNHPGDHIARGVGPDIYARWTSGTGRTKEEITRGYNSREN